MDNHHDSSPDRANGDEPVLIFAVLFIVDHQVVLVTLGSDGTKTIHGAAHRPDRDYRPNYSGGKSAADAKSC